MDEWATAYASEFKVPVNARAWATPLRALQALGWAALTECKKVWKVFCKLRAGESAEVAATAEQVAARARQQRWRETEQLRAGTRETMRAKAAADKERARRLREELAPPGLIAPRAGNVGCLIGRFYSGGPSAISSGDCTTPLPVA